MYESYMDNEKIKNIYNVLSELDDEEYIFTVLKETDKTLISMFSFILQKRVTPQILMNLIQKNIENMHPETYEDLLKIGKKINDKVESSFSLYVRHVPQTIEFIYEF